VRLALALLLVFLAVALAALGFALREAARTADPGSTDARADEGAPLAPDPAPPDLARSPPDSPPPSQSLRLGRTGGSPGRAKVPAPPLEFEVVARSYATGPDGLVLEGLAVENPADAEAFDVTLYALGPGLGPAGERFGLGDATAHGATRPADVEIPVALHPEKDPPALSFYVAYRVARDEPTWLLSGVHPIVLEREQARER